MSEIEEEWDESLFDDLMAEESEDGFEIFSLEELEDELYDRIRDRDADGVYDTADTDGSTTNVQEAMDQGLVYDPPSDPPVLPSDDEQGLEMAAGFAASMETTNADEYELPPNVDNQDLDLKEDVEIELRDNSETGHLDDVHVNVDEGVVWLYGTVPSEEDIAIVDYLVRDIEGVRDVENLLRLEDE